MALRTYQIDVIADLYQQIRDGTKRVLLAAPTGAGKTRIAVAIVVDAVLAGRRVLFCVHRRVLVEQTISAMRDAGIDPGVIASGYSQDLSKQVQVAMVQTLDRRSRAWNNLAAEIVIADECHSSAFMEPLRSKLPPFNRAQLDREPHYIGLSATPYRTSKRESLADFFETIVSCPPPRQLIEMGYLCRPTYLVLSSPNIQGLEVDSNCDWDTTRLSLVMNRSDVTENAIVQWKRYANNSPTLTLCCNIEHAVAVAVAFARANVPTALTVSSLTPLHREELEYWGVLYAIGDKDRQALLDGFPDNATNVVSVASLNEGCDLPPAKTLLILRPTMSQVFHEQALGRVLRPYPSKTNATILDFTGNIKRLGKVEDIIDYVLHPSVPQEFEGNTPFKICSNCGARILAFYRDCPQCLANITTVQTAIPIGNLELSLSLEDTIAFEKLSVALLEAFNRNLNPLDAVRWVESEIDRSVPGAWLSEIASILPKSNTERYCSFISALTPPDEPPLLWLLDRLH